MKVRNVLNVSRVAVLLAMLDPFSLPTVLAAQQAQAVPVRHVQGAGHAFLVLRAESGAVLGYGELLQLVRGDRVSSRLIYHFRDGSLDDETTVFSQRGTFHLISDHHVQSSRSRC